MSNDVEQNAKFKDIMFRYSDMLFSYAYYLSGDREDASDLLQETYLKAFRFFHTFEEGTNAKAWLYRIMRNTYINEYRRVKRLPDIVTYDEHVSEHQVTPYGAHDANNLQDKLDRQMLDDEMTDAISSLPEKFKSVIVLRDLEDLPYEEIAEALEIPIGTVRSRLHRARALLFAKLKAYAHNKGYTVGDSFEPPDFALAV